MKYVTLHNPSEVRLNKYAANGYRVVCCVPSTYTKGMGHIQTDIVVLMEKDGD